MTNSLRSSWAALFCFLTPLSLTAESRPGLEHLLSMPFASELTVSPGGQSIGWVTDERGAHNVWFAAAPSWTARRLTNFNNDDGQEVGELSWSGDGRILLFSRVADLEEESASANPMALPEPPEATLWAASVGDNAAPVEMGQGRWPHMRPHGDRVWFLRKGEIWSVSVKGGAAHREIHVQGSASDLTWSPDGSCLAFTNGREGHSFVGVYWPAANLLHTLSPSVDSDSSPVWSSNGKQIAFLRQPASTMSPLFGPRREGYPWSIQVADVRTGESREVFRAQTGQGSVFHEIASPKQLFWTARDQLVFPWERSGFNHLYGVPVMGGDPRELTPGDGEIESANLSADGNTLLWAGNRLGNVSGDPADVDRRHIWSTDLRSGGPPQQLTRGETIESAVVPVAGADSWALLSSSYDAPFHVELLERGIRRRLGPASPPFQFVRPQQVLFGSRDGLSLHAQVFSPPVSRQRHPAILFLHGGSRRQMLLGFHPMQYYSNAYAMNQYLASLGYVVLSLNYRSGTGYGMPFREALHYGATGASEYQDVVAAGEYLALRQDVDAKRVGVWGGSYGGYLTAMALGRNSDLFAAGVDFHGVHDWNLEFARTPPGDLIARQEFERQAFASSPLAFVNGWSSPVLFIAGDDDRTVAFSETIQMVEALRRRGREPEQLVLPNERHTFLLWSSWMKSYEATADFFDRLLRRQ